MYLAKSIPWRVWKKGHRLNALTPAYTPPQQGEEDIYRFRLINGI